MVAELGEVVWIVDLNRQSLDRVVPGIGATRLQGMFEAAGWQVLTVKYGHLLEELFARPGGELLRDADRPDARTRSTSGCCAARAAELRDPAARRRDRTRAGPRAARRPSATTRCARPSVTWAVTTTRRWPARSPRSTTPGPTVIFAYTVKGYGLAIEGHPQNHSALLTEAQLGELAARTGADPAHPWRGSPTARPRRRCARRPRAGCGVTPFRGASRRAVPADLGRTPAGTATTQSALGPGPARRQPRGPARWAPGS